MGSGLSLGAGPAITNDPFASSGSLPTLGNMNFGVAHKKMTPVEKKEEELFSDLMQMSSNNGQSNITPPPQAPSQQAHSQAAPNPNNPFDLLL